LTDATPVADLDDHKDKWVLSRGKTMREKLKQDGISENLASDERFDNEKSQASKSERDKNKLQLDTVEDTMDKSSKRRLSSRATTEVKPSRRQTRDPTRNRYYFRNKA
jgi:hypothetical protein